MAGSSWVRRLSRCCLDSGGAWPLYRIWCTGHTCLRACCPGLHRDNWAGLRPELREAGSKRQCVERTSGGLEFADPPIEPGAGVAPPLAELIRQAPVEGNKAVLNQEVIELQVLRQHDIDPGNRLAVIKG